MDRLFPIKLFQVRFAQSFSRVYRLKKFCQLRVNIPTMKDHRQFCAKLFY